MNPIRKAIIGGALVATTLGGGALGAALVGSANAQTTPSTTAPATSSDSDTGGQGHGGPGGGDPSKGGHQANGITEALLTGDTATQVKAAVEANQPGATIERMENDAEGATYEAHITKADGSDATVKLDASFKVTEVVDGHG
jgi:hypothetical protein